MKVTIYAYNDEFNKVSFNRYLRQYHGYTIKGAKDIVDLILQGCPVELELKGPANLDELLSDKGVKYEIKSE